MCILLPFYDIVPYMCAWCISIYSSSTGDVVVLCGWLLSAVAAKVLNSARTEVFEGTVSHGKIVLEKPCYIGTHR